MRTVKYNFITRSFCVEIKHMIYEGRQKFSITKLFNTMVFNMQVYISYQISWNFALNLLKHEKFVWKIWAIFLRNFSVLSALNYYYYYYDRHACLINELFVRIRKGGRII